MIQIKIEKDLVNFYDDNKDSPIYTIKKAELPITRTENGRKYSEWITHLMGKTWIDERDLYRLAVLIQKEFPENNIDWSETFFPVEKRQYLNHVKFTKDLISENKKQEKASKSLFDSIKIGMEEQNDEVNKEISKIVENNLAQFGLK